MEEGAELVVQIPRVRKSTFGGETRTSCGRPESRIRPTSVNMQGRFIAIASLQTMLLPSYALRWMNARAFRMRSGTPSGLQASGSKVQSVYAS